MRRTVLFLALIMCVLQLAACDGFPGSEWFRSGNSETGLIRYTDDSGSTFFVDSIEKVPEKYRARAEKNPELRGINKSDSYFLKKRAAPKHRR